MVKRWNATLILFLLSLSLTSAALDINYNDNSLPKVVIGTEATNTTTINNYNNNTYNITNNNYYNLTDYSNIVLYNQTNPDGKNVTLGTGGWFKGLFNWSVIGEWFGWNGNTLTFNESKLNLTIASYTSNLTATMNYTNIFLINQSNAVGNFNQSFNGSNLIINNIAFSDWFNQAVKTTSMPTFAGVATPTIYPLADSTTALYINKADNATHIMTVDSTNGRMGLGITPNYKLDIYQASPTANQILFNVGTSDVANRFSIDEDGDASISGNFAFQNINKGVSWSNNSFIFADADSLVFRYAGTLEMDLDASYLTLKAGKKIRPTADSTTALNIAKAAGTSFVTFDTTNGRVGILTTPTQALDVNGSINSTNTIYAGNDINVANNAFVMNSLGIGTRNPTGGVLNVIGNVNITGNVTANVYHGNIDWVQAPVSVTLTGTNYCDQLDGMISGYYYTCSNCINVATGGAVTCGTVASVLETCGCRVD